MARANRHFVPNQVWHITHRCHQKDFLLKFSKDRKHWLHWLFEAKKRFGLCVLNYTVTSNHIHLLVQDTKVGVIPRSMQLIAGRSAQHYNQRKNRKGAFWEDRYHATAIESDSHLHKCITYIDLNMVRAGVVKHPKDWQHGGYIEIQNPPSRYSIINLAALVPLCGFSNIASLQGAHRQWVETALEDNAGQREAFWSSSVAVGNEAFVRNIQTELGVLAKGRSCKLEGEKFVLKEPDVTYNVVFDGEKVVLSE
ncbi:MAG: transposase [Gammaproteobacteria bacterium]|nr:transposase [Gammaproteobacteria bacterium]